MTDNNGANMREQLLELLYAHIHEIGGREFQCLEVLIEEGDIKTFEELAAYGIE